MTALFEREDWHLLRTLDGVCQVAGCNAADLPFVVMKELADNACDAAGTCFILLDHNGVSVSDDGPGLEGSDEDIAALFSPGRPLRSSKLLRRPTRGAMGNGLRVVVGAVLAHGGTIHVSTPRHNLTLSPQDDGSSKIMRKGTDFYPGTLVSVVMPGVNFERVRSRIPSLKMLAHGDTYQGKSSPWWYTSDAFHELFRASSTTVRDLVASLEGLSGANAGKVAEAFKGREARSLTLVDVDALLRAARPLAREVKPERLGSVGDLEGYCHAKETGVASYSPAKGSHGARIPFVVEAWARPSKAPGFTLMVNRSPVIASHQSFRGSTDKNCQVFYGCGLHFAVDCGRFTGEVIVNVIAPYLPRTDNGKAPDLTALRASVGGAVESAIKRAKRASPSQATASQVSIILDELPAAVARAGDNGANRFSLRQLFYKVRPVLIGATKKEPSYQHFCKTIAKHEDDNGKIAGMYRDARGVIYHPHLRQEIPLGTLSVEKYTRPEWTFGAVLYIEKEGYVASLRENGWPERNDCALMTGKGFASGAARDLIDLLGSEDRDLLFFCVHDADGPGTMIYQALQEATVARRQRRVRIIDLGLNPEEGRAMGLQVEPVNRKGRTPVARYVPPADAEWLQKNRIELNAMSTGQFLEWLDRKIAPHLRGKVVPPAAHLQKTLAVEVQGSLLTKLREEAILQARVQERAGKAMLSMMPTLSELTPNLAGYVRADLESNPTHSWSKVIHDLGAAIATGDGHVIGEVRCAPVVPDRSPPPPTAEADEDPDEDGNPDEDEDPSEDPDEDEENGQ